MINLHFLKVIEKPRIQIFIITISLFIQNLILFSGHYFNNIGFPWDFQESYYSLPAFWTTAVSLGFIPQWIPFQGMGVPFAMLPWSGFHYPPFWIFPLLHIPYTLHAAVMMQVFHIFFGSVGMFFFLKLITKSNKYALLGAVAFQFFGGFYSNSEHADVIRAFAITPWIFYTFTLDTSKFKIHYRNLFIPLSLFFLVTGGYPGNLISTLFIMSLFTLSQIINGLIQKIEKKHLLKLIIIIISLALLGLIMSSVHLGPILQEKNEITRFQNYTAQDYFILWTENIPSLFMSNKVIPGEISMSSAYVTLPILIFASFIPLKQIRKHWIFAFMLIVSTLMVTGNKSFFWQFVTTILPYLKLMRAPSSDYRVFIDIFIIILGISGLKAILQKDVTRKLFVIKTSFVVGWFVIGILMLYHGIINIQTILASIVLIITLMILAFSRKFNLIDYAKHQKQLKYLLVLLFIFLIFGDGVRVISDMPTWHEIPADWQFIHFNIPEEKNGKLITYSIFDNIPKERPSREIVSADFQSPWGGYLQGHYMMQDYGGLTLNARSIMESNNVYRDYMLMKWTPIFLDTNIVQNESRKITIPDSIFMNARTTHNNYVTQIHYGIDDITYNVSLKEPKLMIENEIYFSGWQANLITNKEIILKPIIVNDAFRGWLLPAGDYQLKTFFEFPNLIIYEFISLFSFIGWVFILIYRRKYFMNMTKNLNEEL